MPKFPVGPTSSRPGPILLKVAATAVKFVIRLKSSKAIRNMEDAKISTYTMKKIFVERTTSCGMAGRLEIFPLLILFVRDTWKKF